jgi:hypothetical protein
MKRVGLVVLFAALWFNTKGQDNVSCNSVGHHSSSLINFNLDSSNLTLNKKFRVGIYSGPARNLGHLELVKVPGRKDQYINKISKYNWFSISFLYNITSKAGFSTSYDLFYDSEDFKHRNSFLIGAFCRASFGPLYFSPLASAGISFFRYYSQPHFSLKTEIGLKIKRMNFCVVPFVSKSLSSDPKRDDVNLGLGFGTSYGFSIKKSKRNNYQDIEENSPGLVGDTINPRLAKSNENSLPKKKQTRKFSVSFGGSFIPLESDPRYYNSFEFKGVNKNLSGYVFSCSYGFKIIKNTWLSLFRTSYGGTSNINIEETHSYVIHWSGNRDEFYTTTKRYTKDVSYSLVTYGLKVEQVLVNRLFFLSTNLSVGKTSEYRPEGLKQDFKTDHLTVGIESNIGLHFKRERFFLTPNLVLPFKGKNYRSVKYDYATLFTLGYSHSLYQSKVARFCSSLF